MSQSDSSESDPPDSSPISSGQIETPRGGFMARPGLKAPPRHAVVVRVGDAPLSADIPVARSSFPPPPPSSVPAPESPSEKVTVRAIPTPRPPGAVLAPAAAALTHVAAANATIAVEPTQLPVLIESAPPPSDAPVVAHVVDRVSAVPRSRRAARSRLTILAAALAGLVLGVVSVVTTVHVRDTEKSAAAPAAGVALATLPEVAAPAAPPAPVEAAPAASAESERRAAERERGQAALPPAPARGNAVKRSIF